MNRQLPGIAAHFIRAHWRWATLRGAALTRYQERRARRIVALARQRSPFYRAHWAGHDGADWRSLPTVDKRLMMDHFDIFNTLGIRRDEALAVALRAERERDFRPTLGGVTVGLSSGTSGHRGLFLASPWEQVAWAGTILARALHELRPGYRVAFFLRANSNLYQRTSGTLIDLRYFDLMLPLDEAVPALNAYRPHLVVGPPSLLGLLADARRAGRLTIRPTRLISVAEVLEPQDQARLEDTFAAPVHQIYQCTEGLLAVSCRAGSLHVQEDLVALQTETLPADPADGDEPARVTPIVTDLWRTSQPIVRYQLNDVLRLAPRPCRCGSAFRVIQAIEGRQDDICYFETLAGQPRPFFPDTIRRMVLLASAAIEDYQAVQERCGHLRLRLVTPPDAAFAPVARAVRAQVAATVAAYGCRPATVEIEEGLASSPPGAKRRRVQRVGLNHGDRDSTENEMR